MRNHADHTGASKYRLKVTAGTEYNPDTHQPVPVNENQTLRIENKHATVSLCVRIQNFTGYPDNAPQTHAYFSDPQHTNDQYSISFSIIFKHPVNGDALVFGNDFDRPIRDRLPPGFNAALRLVKWTLDPALDGDAYADKPYLFSPALATLNQLRVGDKVSRDDEVPTLHDTVVSEGADGSGAQLREGSGVPGDVDGRRRHFQDEEMRKGFVFEEGRVYSADFGNPYLDFNDFSLRLPGFTLHAIKYIDEKSHDLRYVLKDRDSGQVYLVVLFTLVLLGTESEPIEKDEIEKQSHESQKANDEHNGNLGKFDWAS
ncbi:hypothetical protein PHISP_08068 [Aspergillus sp. HF37]|nr:hypothetical protein PHISP_08068 [Aspergillus sp. HF37]